VAIEIVKGALAVVAMSIAIAACGLTTGPELSFECKCHESEDVAGAHTLAVCAENEHAAIAAAKKCQGTASNAACTCAAQKGACKLGGCR
jgi:hypothetical protein